MTIARREDVIASKPGRRDAAAAERARRMTDVNAPASRRRPGALRGRRVLDLRRAPRRALRLPNPNGPGVARAGPTLASRTCSGGASRRSALGGDGGKSGGGAEKSAPARYRTPGADRRKAPRATAPAETMFGGEDQPHLYDAIAEAVATAFDLDAPQVVAFVGEAGSGKSESAKLALEFAAVAFGDPTALQVAVSGPTTSRLGADALVASRARTRSRSWSAPLGRFQNPVFFSGAESRASRGPRAARRRSSAAPTSSRPSRTARTRGTGTARGARRSGAPRCAGPPPRGAWSPAAPSTSSASSSAASRGPPATTRTRASSSAAPRLEGRPRRDGNFPLHWLAGGVESPSERAALRLRDAGHGGLPPPQRDARRRRRLGPRGARSPS